MEFIVAPYEADAQMAYLALNGRVHAVRPCTLRLLIAMGTPLPPAEAAPTRGLGCLATGLAA